MMRVTLTFVVGYRTSWGQQLYICGAVPELGMNDESKAVKMTPASGELWEAEVTLDRFQGLAYRYLVCNEDTGEVLHEFGQARKLSVDAVFEKVHIRDYWRPQRALENALYTAPFTQAFFSRQQREPQVISYDLPAHSYIRLQLRAPRIAADYQMGILGSSEALGNWDESRVVFMSDQDFPVWKADIPIHPEDQPFEYKFVIYSHKEGRVVTWETGGNRYFPMYDFSKAPRLVVHTEEFFRYPVGDWKCAGVAIPVFSLRSDAGAGVGEFSDLKLLVDWAVRTGMKVVQVLPVNDTVATHTWVDSYPYAAISVEALHPLYAHLPSIGKLTDATLQAEMDAEAARLNALPEVDYEAVMQLKSRFFKYVFDEQAEEFLKSPAFLTFLEANRKWLPGYAAFSYLRDRFGTPDFTRWGKYQQLSDSDLAALVEPNQPHYPDIAIHYFIQFHLDQQLKEATAYARDKGVVLKGDIPIGIYRNSLDAWRHPHLFHMDTQAGAPPDDFSVLGQNWGFPTYNWEKMALDGYQWWRDRMVKMSEYFDVFRIDHILGFFRIWEIPWEHVEGLMGHFNPALPLDQTELTRWGINWDESRYCQPYITQDVILQIFKNHAEWVAQTFLNATVSGKYVFQEAFDSQRKVKAYLEEESKRDPDSREFFHWLQAGLNRLHGEVLFLKTADGTHYNPRIGLHGTFSFAALDPQSRERLDRLYIHYFYQRHNDFWRDSAMQKLPMLKDATDMLICGEDLGMVPACVPGVMDELQILSLAIQRMPNDDREFWNPADTPYMSVTSTGSHDMSTLREWWQEDSQRTQRFYNHILGHWEAAPQYCEAWVARDVIAQHLRSPSMLAIFPIQDLLAMNGQLRRVLPEEERINIPAVAQHYWRYRLHLSMEDLLRAEGFNSFLRQLVDQCGRSADY